MMMKLLPLFITSMALTLPMIYSPLSLGVYILIMTLMMTMMMCILTSSWLAMATFLIYIGGMLVLFSYFLAIQPNQFMPISSFGMTSLILLLLTAMNTNKFYIPQLMFFKNMMPSMPFIMNNNNLSFIITIITILLLILVVVVKMTTSSFGPLRPFS